jgi:hypothetical protein
MALKRGKLNNETPGKTLLEWHFINHESEIRSL